MKLCDELREALTDSSEVIIKVMDPSLKPTTQYLVGYKRKTGDISLTPNNKKAKVYTRTKARQIISHLRGFGDDYIWLIEEI